MLSELHRLVAVDTETTGLYPWHGHKPFAVSIYSPTFKVYERATVRSTSKGPRVEWSVEQLNIFRNTLSVAAIPKVFHNAGFDICHLEVGLGIGVAGDIYDTMDMAHHAHSYELGPTGKRQGAYALKWLSKRYLDISDDDETELKKATRTARKKARKSGQRVSGTVEQDYWRAPPHLVRRYCIRDTKRTYELFNFYRKILKLQGGWSAYLDEMPLTRIMANVTKRGFRVFPNVAASARRANAEVVESSYKLLQESWKKNGGTGYFDANRQTHVHELLYKQLQLSPIGYTKTGKPKADRETLERYLDVPEVFALLRLRVGNKAQGAMFDQFSAYAVPENGYHVVHPSQFINGTRTGRLTVRNPNVQQAAKKGQYQVLPVSARAYFGPRPDYRLYLFDWSQVEVRIFAELSNEPNMIHALRAGKDIHTEVCNRLWGGNGNDNSYRLLAQLLEIDSVGRARKGQRSDAILKAWQRLGWNGDGAGLSERVISQKWLALHKGDIASAEKALEKDVIRILGKHCTFAKLFGGGKRAVSRSARCSLEDAESFLTDYAKAFPMMRVYANLITGTAKRQGYILLDNGRRLAVDVDKAYKGINYSIQGRAARFLKSKIIEMDGWLRSSEIRGGIVHTAHDEILIELHKDDSTRSNLLKMRQIMETSPFRVPIKVDVKRVTKSWDQEEKIGWLENQPGRQPKPTSIGGSSFST